LKHIAKNNQTVLVPQECAQNLSTTLRIIPPTDEQTNEQTDGVT